MKKLLFFNLAPLLLSSLLFAQNYRTLSPGEPYFIQSRLFLDDQQTIGGAITHTSDPSSGAVSSSAVTSLKIAEATNVYGYIQLTSKQIVSRPEAGGSGALGFIYRQNIAPCIGGTGQFRYSLSVDGGATWQIGASGSVPPSPPQNACWGSGPINSDVGVPIVTDPAILGKSGRYPNMGLFSLSNSTSIDSLSLAFVAPVIVPTSGWDGFVAGATTNLTQGGTTTDEQIRRLLSNTNAGACHSLIQQHPDSLVWYYLSVEYDLSQTTNGLITDFLTLNKGVFDPVTKQLSWSIAENWDFTFFGSSANSVGNVSELPVIAFAPDGQKGYIAFLGDMVGEASDTVLAPILIETLDGGQTWGTPFELDLNRFSNLSDAMQRDTFMDLGGDLFWLEPSVTTAFQFDMEVDKFGNPHIFTVVGGNKRGSTDPSIADVQRNSGAIYTGDFLYHFDITKDQNGDWNMLKIGPQKSFRGYFGDLTLSTNESDNISLEIQPQVARNSAGDRVFFAWSDTDTAINPAMNGPLDPSGTPSIMTNYAPDLFTFALNVDRQLVSPATNWTASDNLWASRAVAPRVADLVLESNGDWILPTTLLSLDGTSALNPVSFHYVSDVQISENDFVSPACYITDSFAVVNIQPPFARSDDTGINTFKVFPNPTSETAYVHAEVEPGELASIELLDHTGRILTRIRFSGTALNTTLSLEGKAAGLYFVRLITRKGSAVRKLMLSN